MNFEYQEIIQTEDHNALIPHDVKLNAIRSIVKKIPWHPTYAAKQAGRERVPVPLGLLPGSSIKDWCTFLVVQHDTQIQPCVRLQVPELKFQISRTPFFRFQRNDPVSLELGHWDLFASCNL